MKIFWFKKYLSGTGSFFKGNYVYSCAMNLAWNDLKSNILKSDNVLIKTRSKLSLDTCNKLNASKFNKNDLDETSYYIKSGFGSRVLEIINKESTEKFPNKSFQDLSMMLSDSDAICYAYFCKKVEYLNKFSKDVLIFKGKKVTAFTANSFSQKNNIQVLEYQNDKKFVIAIKLKDDSDELIIAKGFDMNDPSEITNKILSLDTNRTSPMKGDEAFFMPNISFDFRRDYEELINKKLSNNGFENYMIAQMFENIKFEMDFKGAGVENEAAILIAFASVLSIKDKPRSFILDNPFWVFMRKKNSTNPYFILGVKNTDIMELVS